MNTTFFITRSKCYVDEKRITTFIGCALSILIPIRFMTRTRICRKDSGVELKDLVQLAIFNV